MATNLSVQAEGGGFSRPYVPGGAVLRQTVSISVQWDGLLFYKITRPETNRPFSGLKTCLSVNVTPKNYVLLSYQFLSFIISVYHTMPSSRYYSTKIKLRLSRGVLCWGWECSRGHCVPRPTLPLMRKGAVREKYVACDGVIDGFQRL